MNCELKRPTISLADQALRVFKSSCPFACAGTFRGLSHIDVTPERGSSGRVFVLFTFLYARDRMDGGRLGELSHPGVGWAKIKKKNSHEGF